MGWEMKWLQMKRSKSLSARHIFLVHEEGGENVGLVQLEKKQEFGGLLEEEMGLVH